MPLLPGALECVRANYIPGGLKSNRQFAKACVVCRCDVPEDVLTLLYDPQTAGGLLISVAEADGARLLKALRDASIPAVEIGEVVEKRQALIAVAE